MTIFPDHLAAPGSPRFDQHLAKHEFTGIPAKVNLSSHPEAPMWRTRLGEGASRGPNFAGRFTIVGWGCGTDCTHIAIVDATSGAVYFPKNLRSLVWTNVYDDVLRDDVLRFRKDSDLLIVVGMPNDEPAARGVSYYVWTGSDLRLIFRTGPRR